MYYIDNTVYFERILTMVSFDNINLEDGIPIYLQILKYIKQGIVSGKIKNNEELPSRRVLSAFLGVNPNTIQKAYKILEDENLIESHLGAKSYMKFDSEKISLVKNELIENEIRKNLLSLKYMGLTREEYIKLIDKYWNEV